MPKRKRTRRRINPGPILVIGIVIVLLAGVFYSPLTSLSLIEIDGAKPGDRATIQEIVSSLNGVPWIKVNARWVEARVMRIEAVDHATYSQNVFGRGRLVVTYRVPVARSRSARPVGLDATGTMFETDQLPPDLPMITRPKVARDLQVSVIGSFPSAIVADLAVKARRMAPQAKLSIWFDETGALCLNMGTGLVILGSSDDLDVKLQSLKDILDQQPALLDKAESLNLTDPTHPVTKYKKTKQ